jgi:hypothetical protein
MKVARRLKRRRRNKPFWTTPVVAAVAVIGVGVWLGSSPASGRTMLPTFVHRARTGIQQLGTAVLSRFRATEASDAAGQQGSSSTSTSRSSQRRPRVVPFSKKP